MEIRYLSKGSSRRLIAIFLGWAMDWRPFAGLRRDGYDVAVVWNYTDTKLDTLDWKSYDEICVVGWSMGVYFSTFLPSEIESRVTRRIAINGTLWPMDDTRGIPEAVFKGTLSGLNDRNLDKFYLRVCGSRVAYDGFMTCRPQRTLDQLRGELKGMLELPSTSARFDVAIIGKRDAIFPPGNQRNAWKGVPVEETDSPHLPDFQAVLDRFIVNKDLVRERFTNGLNTYESEACVQEELVEELYKHISPLGVSDVLEAGCGTGLLSRKINGLEPRTFHMWDVCEVQPFPGAMVQTVDAETAIMRCKPESFDLIASASAIQWFNSPGAFLKHASTALRPGGYIALGTYARGNLHEITSLIPGSLPLFSLEEWKEIIPDELEILYTRQWNRTLDFETPMDAFRHLKLTGVNSLGRSGSGLVSLRGLMDRYAPGEDGRWHLTYLPLIFLLQKKNIQS